MSGDPSFGAANVQFDLADPHTGLRMVAYRVPRWPSSVCLVVPTALQRGEAHLWEAVLGFVAFLAISCAVPASVGSLLVGGYSTQFVLVSGGIAIAAAVLLAFVLIRVSTRARRSHRFFREAAEACRGTQVEPIVRTFCGRATHPLRAVPVSRRRLLRMLDWDVAEGNPSIIAINIAMPASMRCSDAFEPLDLGVVGAEDPLSARASQRWLLMMAIGTGLAGVLAVRFRPMWPIVAIFATAALNAVRGVAGSMLDFSSRFAEPGRVSSSAWGRVREFTPSDSLLILDASGGPGVMTPRWNRRHSVNVTLIRRDGAAVGFGCEGPHDPRISGLLVRWCTPRAD